MKSITLAIAFLFVTLPVLAQTTTESGVKVAKKKEQKPAEKKAAPAEKKAAPKKSDDKK